MRVNRKNFIKSIGALSLFSGINPVNVFSQHAQHKEFSLASPPYLQNFKSDSITIFAVFNKTCLAWLEIIDEHNAIKETIYQVEDGMRNANSELFKFKVSHRNKNFRYRVVGKEVLKFEAYKIEYGKTIQSNIIHTELPLLVDNNVNILVLNDIHGNQSAYPELYNKSTLVRKDLIIINGDSLNHIDKKDDILNKLSIPVAETFGSKTAFILVRGNHETRGPYARNLKKYLEYPKNKFYQAFGIGSIYFIILDGGEDKPDNHEVYAGTIDYDTYRLEQKEWLAEVLVSKERKKAKHTIIINHIPWMYSDDWHGTKHNYKCFHKLANTLKVDAVLSGHTHKAAFHKPSKDHNYYVIIGAGPKVGERTFVEIYTNKESLTINLKKEDGSIINYLSKQ